MNASSIASKRFPAVGAGWSWLGWVVALMLAISCDSSVARGQPAGNDDQGVSVLTRGPVHEAFAGMIAFNPEPGVVVAKAPPDNIEEIPPEERPQGDNVAWIPGYWAWDDERGDFLWISGTWRSLPPGREWTAGYWARTNQGYQWASGYWADAAASATTYLPAPPPTVEAGPNVAALSGDYVWTPGYWIWLNGRYAWRPGYWTQVQPDWDWVPAHYLWTPRGYVFVEGFWDYPIERRGLLFAPVHFQSRVYSRRGYYYAPTIVINLTGMMDHLFLRPSYQHYYFGDYYAASYSRVGYFPSYAFQSSRHGYDPFFSRQRWEHRQDREWESRLAVNFQYRRDNAGARPPRTWIASPRGDPRAPETPSRTVVLATPIDQLARSKVGPQRFQPVARDERQVLTQRGRDVQQSREQRRTLESKVEGPAPVRPGGALEPAAVPRVRSPIVARPISQLERNQAPPALPPISREGPSRPEAEPRARESNSVNPAPDPPRNFKGRAPQAPPESERRSQPPGAPTKQGAARNLPSEPARQERQVEPQKGPPPAAEPAPAPSDPDPPKPGKRGEDREGKGKP